MKWLNKIFLLNIFLILLQSCNKVELPEEVENTGKDFNISYEINGITKTITTGKNNLYLYTSYDNGASEFEIKNVNDSIDNESLMFNLIFNNIENTTFEAYIKEHNNFNIEFEEIVEIDSFCINTQSPYSTYFVLQNDTLKSKFLPIKNNKNKTIQAGVKYLQKGIEVFNEFYIDTCCLFVPLECKIIGNQLLVLDNFNNSDIYIDSVQTNAIPLSAGYHNILLINNGVKLKGRVYVELNNFKYELYQSCVKKYLSTQNNNMAFICFKNKNGKSFYSNPLDSEFHFELNNVQPYQKNIQNQNTSSADIIFSGKLYDFDDPNDFILIKNGKGKIAFAHW